MKKITLLIIPFAIILSPILGQNKANNENPSKGIKTKIEIQYHYEEKFGEFNEISSQKYITKYDLSGYEVERSNYWPDGSLVYKRVTEYDKNGMKAKESTFISNRMLLTREFIYINGKEVEFTDYDYSTGNVEAKEITKYDSDGNLVERSIYDSDGNIADHPWSKVICKYDIAGNRIEESNYDSDGTINQKHSYKYNSAGEMIEASRYNEEGVIEWKKTWKYENNSKRVYEYTKMYYPDYLIGNKTHWKYYSEGYDLESLWYDEAGKLERKEIRKFDLDDNLVESSDYEYDSEGNLATPYNRISKTINKYDTNGNCIEESSYDLGGLLVQKHSYRYNSDGKNIEWLRYGKDELLEEKIIYRYNNNLLVEEMKFKYEFKFDELQEKPNFKTTYEYEEY